MDSLAIVIGVLAVIAIVVLVSVYLWIKSKRSHVEDHRGDNANGTSNSHEKSDISRKTTDDYCANMSENAEGKKNSTEYDIPENSHSRMQRLRSRLAHSANPFGKALFSILSRDNLTESDWEEVEDTLLLADVGADTSMEIVENLRRDARVNNAQDVQAIRSLLREELLKAVDADKSGNTFNRTLEVFRNHTVQEQKSSEHQLPGLAVSQENDSKADITKKTHVIMMVGVNGSGKTTTAGKLSRLLISDGITHVVLGAADTFRAAAADQLETWAQRVGVQIVKSDKEGADPASVAFEAAEFADTSHADVLIVDTAGRLQNKANLMDELGKIRRVVEKKLPVQEVLLVLDATTGQNGMAQAKVFSEAIGITGIVLTKLDGSAKGGIVISVQRDLGVPVKLVGLGEGADDLATFDSQAFVDGILGE